MTAAHLRMLINDCPYARPSYIGLTLYLAVSARSSVETIILSSLVRIGLGIRVTTDECFRAAKPE